MKDWLLAVLGTVLAFLVITCAVGLQSRHDMPQHTAEAFVPSGPLAWLGNARPGSEEYRLACAARVVAAQERAVVTRNLSPGQRLEDTVCRTAGIVQDSRYTIEERIEALGDLQRRMNYETAVRQPIVRDVMNGSAYYR